jgi:cytochrome c biogenesis protein CcdA
VFDAPLAAAFTAGMVATVNPCGFAMLPAYLSYFLGLDRTATDDAEAEAPSTAASLLRALLVSVTVSAGFLVLFAAAGAIVSWTAVSVGEFSPWLTVVIGLVLAIVGVAFVFGWEPKVAVPRLDKGGRTRGLWSMFVFGLSYAIASLSCTIGPFTTVVATTFSRSSVAAGVLAFAAYALGMGLLLTALTVALALARQGFVTRLRRALPYVSKVSGVIMAVVGVYLVWYGIYEIRLIQRGDQNAASGPVGVVTRWSSDVSTWLSSFDPIQVALVLGIVVCAGILIALLRVGRGPHGPADASGPGDQA